MPPVSFMEGIVIALACVLGLLGISQSYLAFKDWSANPKVINPGEETPSDNGWVSILLGMVFQIGAIGLLILGWILQWNIDGILTALVWAYAATTLLVGVLFVYRSSRVDIPSPMPLHPSVSGRFLVTAYKVTGMIMAMFGIVLVILAVV